MRASVKARVNVAHATLMTDEYTAYLGTNGLLPHEVIKHATWYVDGTIHSNTIEGFWALLKCGMFGQFHSLSQRHLQRYVDEFCYRYNLRGVESNQVFKYTIDLSMGVI